MRSNLFKRSHLQSEGLESPDVMTREVVEAAHKTATKLASYLDEVQASFRDVHCLHEADRKLATFLNRKTDLVPGAVISAVTTINDMESRFASDDFNYEEETDLNFPHDLLDADISMKEVLEDPSLSNAEAEKGLGNSEIPEVKVAASALLDAQGAGKPSDAGKSRWDNFSSEALTEMIQSLVATDGFATDTESQRSVAEMAEILAARPMVTEVEDEVKDAPEPKKASKLGGLVVAELDHTEAPLAPNTTNPNDSNELAREPRWNTPNDSIDNNMLDGKDTQMNVSASEKTAIFLDAFGKCEKCGKTTGGAPGTKKFVCPDCEGKTDKETGDGKTAAANDELKDAESASKHIQKMIDSVEGFDLLPISGICGATRAQGVESKIKDLREALGQVLKEAESKAISFEVAEENEKVRKESKKKPSLLRGLQLAGIE